MLNILELKSHRRMIYNSLNNQRLENESLRSEVDQAHLKYQCLVYEINHFQKQISLCKEYECKQLNHMLEGVPQLEENFSFINKLTDISSDNI